MAEGRPCLGVRDELHVVHYKRTSWPYEGMCSSSTGTGERLRM